MFAGFNKNVFQYDTYRPLGFQVNKFKHVCSLEN